MIRAAAVNARTIPAASLAWITFGAAAALLVGSALAWNLAIGFGLAFVIAVGVAVALRPANLLVVLTGAVFIELVKIGGVAVTRLVAPIAVLVLLAAMVRKETAIHWSPPLGWALAYAVWALASGLWTESVSGTIYALASLSIALVYMLAFGSLITTKAELTRVLYMFAVFSLVLGLFSLMAFTGRHPLGFTLSTEGRSAGGGGNPNFFAAIQVIALPIIVALAANERKRWRLGFLAVACLVNIGSIVSTLSRGGTLSLLLILLLLLFLPARTLFKTRLQKLAVVAVIFLGLGAFMFRYAGDVAPRLTSTFGGSQQTEAGSGRLAIWPVAWHEFTQHPVTGIGYGAFVEVSVDRILDSPISQDFELFKTEPKEVHNAYLGSLTELGVFGLVLFLGLLISTGLALRRTAKRARAVGEYYIANVANALILGLAGWAVGSVFAESETARPRWIVVGICLALPKLLPSDDSEPAPTTTSRGWRQPGDDEGG